MIIETVYSLIFYRILVFGWISRDAKEPGVLTVFKYWVSVWIHTCNHIEFIPEKVIIMPLAVLWNVFKKLCLEPVISHRNERLRAAKFLWQGSWRPFRALQLSFIDYASTWQNVFGIPVPQIGRGYISLPTSLKFDDTLHYRKWLSSVYCCAFQCINWTAEVWSILSETCTVYLQSRRRVSVGGLVQVYLNLNLKILPSLS